MATKLPDLAPIDFTSLDFDSLISLADTLIKNHPEYFANVDDFNLSNAGKMVIDLVSYIVDMLANRIDWVANENTLPTATQKSRVIDLLKLINYRLSLPTTAAATITATISSWISPFTIPARYSIPAKDLDGNNTTFELLQKNSSNKYIYEGIGSYYEFDTNVEVSPILSQNDLVFYQGSSYREFFTMSGVDNEMKLLSRKNAEEDSIRVWKVTRNVDGEVISQVELEEVTSFISQEAQSLTGTGEPPYKIQTTENDSAYIVFGEAAVVEIFSNTGTEEIMIWYRITKGVTGNITANSINYTTSIVASGQNVQIFFLNTSAGTGGAASETIEHAKQYGPLSITTVEKTVNPDDFVILLERFSSVLSAIAYGKTNEPNRLYTDYGYRIPPYEVWLYSVYNKTGWENFDSYSYPMSMRIDKPYVRYGVRDTENVFFDGTDSQLLTKLKYNSLDNDKSNILVTNLTNSTVYTAGVHYVIDQEGRTISRIDGGAIPEESAVIIQYYENNKMDEYYVLINFADAETQNIETDSENHPVLPICPNVATSAHMSNFSTTLTENTLSENDYNWPDGDYKIDYENGTITRNSENPYLESKSNIGFDKTLYQGINDELILDIDGILPDVFNRQHHLDIYTYNNRQYFGDGSGATLFDGITYSFNISIDNETVTEYSYTESGTVSYTASELATKIWSSFLVGGSGGAFSLSGAYIFVDQITSPTTPILVFMTVTEGILGSIELSAGTTGTDLFSLTGMNIGNAISSESVDIIELATRTRIALNESGIVNNFSGQDLPDNKEEKPEIYSNSNVESYSSFEVPGASSIAINLTGSSGYDGSKDIALTTVIANMPYDLRNFQRRFDLINDFQNDIDNAGTGIGAVNIVETFWMMQNDGFYRVGLRQIDTTGGTASSITIENPFSGASATSTFSFNENQSSLDQTLIEAKISEDSNMISDIRFKIELKGGTGNSAFIKTLTEDSINSNTINLFGFKNNQYQYGGNIRRLTLPAIADMAGENGVYGITSGTDDQLCLIISGSPDGGIPDGEYVITIPASSSYNIDTLTAALNIATETANGNKDISSFIKFERIQGELKIQTLMTSFVGTPDVEISDSDNLAINTACAEKLGFFIGDTMSRYSTIILSYAGNWISDYDSDTSEATSIIKYLKSKRLIGQDYIIKDPTFSTFDIKADVYVTKGYDRSIVKSEVESLVRSNYTINEAQFSDSVASSSILSTASTIKGISYITTGYFGRDYQLYDSHVNGAKYAYKRGTKEAHEVPGRWSVKSAFNLTIDGCTVGGVNYDGSYLVTIGNNWTDYDGIVEQLMFNPGGLSSAVSLAPGSKAKDLTNAIKARHYNGVFEIYTVNTGSAVSMKFEDPSNTYLQGYQAFTTTENVVSYTANSTYSVDIEINGAAGVDYQITSPTSGAWTLGTIASQLNESLASGSADATASIDIDGKIRITSTLGGPNSTIVLSVGATIDLFTVLGGGDSSIDGSDGYVSCIEITGGSLYLGSGTVYGKDSEPDSSYDYYNYKTTINSNYDEILSLSNDYFISGSTTTVNQKHGIIFNYYEAEA